jgi:four helix bundle protein
MGTSFRELQVWRLSMSLTKDIYKITKRFPDDERFGLISQLRRAAVSIPSNIAEGQARYSQREFLRFLSNAKGSLAEVETQLLLSTELGYVPEDELNKLTRKTAEVGRMLNGLYSAIQLRTENRELGTPSTKNEERRTS